MSLKAESLKAIDQALRKELRERRKALDEFVAQIHANRRTALLKARHSCDVSKQRAKARVADIRATAKKDVERVRESARTSCERGKAKAKRVGEKALRAALGERKQALADERNILRGKKRKTDVPKRTRRREVLDEARHDVPPALRDVFEQVKDQFQGHARKSVAEQFTEWAEENPDEVLALQSAHANKFLEEALKEQRAADRALRSRKQLRANDWAAIGTNPDEIRAVGLNPDDPDDVLAFLAGYTQHWRDMAANEVPF